MRHHEAQEMGRREIFADYHLRVGQFTTAVGQGATVILIDSKRPSDWVKNTSAEDAAEWLGLPSKTEALVAWDVFDAFLTPGDVILLMSWRDHIQAETFENTLSLQDGARLRRVRVIRDYGMYDRREAPQYFPDVRRAL